MSNSRPSSSFAVTLGIHQVANEPADLAHVSRNFREAFLGGVKFLQNHHGQEYIMFFKTEQGCRVMHQDIGVQDVQAFVFSHWVGFPFAYIKWTGLDC